MITHALRNLHLSVSRRNILFLFQLYANLAYDLLLPLLKAFTFHLQRLKTQFLLTGLYALIALDAAAGGLLEPALRQHRAGCRCSLEMRR